ncbi:MAG: hypothetical protein Q8M54_11390 [Desulfobaccales bacterium]|nr:hypothetical protein [Desulfobaccales bacterium]
MLPLRDGQPGLGSPNFGAGRYPGDHREQFPDGAPAKAGAGLESVIPSLILALIFNWCPSVNPVSVAAGFSLR